MLYDFCTFIKKNNTKNKTSKYSMNQSILITTELYITFRKDKNIKRTWKM